MPRRTATEEALDSDPVRVCAHCQRAKTIRGVWYLIRGTQPAGPFLCEGCYGVFRATA